MRWRGWWLVLCWWSLGCRGVLAELDTTVGDVSVLDGGSEAPPGPPPAVTTTGCWQRPLLLAERQKWGLSGLAALADGEALFVWSSLDGAPRHGLLARRLFLDGGLGPPARIGGTGSQGGEVVAHPRVVSSRAGRAMAMWIERDDAGVHALRVNRYEPDGGWQGPERLNEGTPAYLATTGGAFDEGGAPVVTWLQFAAANVRVLHARRWREGRWSDVETLSLPGGIPSSAVLSSDEAGLVAVAWVEYGPPDFVERVHATTWSRGLRRDDAWAPVGSPGVPLMAVTGTTATVLAPSVLFDARVFLLAQFDAGLWTRAPDVPSPAGWSGGRLGADHQGRLRLWWEEFPSGGGFRLHEEPDLAAPWPGGELIAEQDEGLRFLWQGSNSRGRAVLAWGRGATVVLRRSEADAGVLDSLDGVIAGDDSAALSVAASGARWLLVHEREAPYRPLALSCP